MKITQHQESYNVTVDAGEEVSITIAGVTKNWTVAEGKTGQFSAKFNEEAITE